MRVGILRLSRKLASSAARGFNFGSAPRIKKAAHCAALLLKFDLTPLISLIYFYTDPKYPGELWADAGWHPSA